VAMGVQRRSDRHPRMDARERVSALPLGRLRRGGAPLRPRVGLWGLTASDGPGWTTRKIHGIERSFFDYVARGVPYGPDDGTIAPWAVVASLPFAPEIVLPTLQHLQDVYPQITDTFCLRCSFNLSFSNEADGDVGWTSPYHFGINLGPVVLMCENYRSGLLWRLMRACPYVVTGLRRAGFTKGWL